MAYDIAKIRADFPLLGCKVYGRELAYLDNGATAQKPLQVIEKIDYLHRELNANVHRGLHYLSEECTSEYEAAREQVRVQFRREVYPCGRQRDYHRNGTSREHRSVAVDLRA